GAFRWGSGPVGRMAYIAAREEGANRAVSWLPSGARFDLLAGSNHVPVPGVLCRLDERALVRYRGEMLPQQVLPEVAVEIPPDRVNVVAVVLCVVELDQEGRALDAIV